MADDLRHLAACVSYREVNLQHSDKSYVSAETASSADSHAIF